MSGPECNEPSPWADGLTRRGFLQAGAGLAALGASSAVAGPRREMSGILLFLVGGPSHLDTWDMKPDAPSEFRGPFTPIATRVPGLNVSEVFPRLAGMADKVAFVRSVRHDAAAVHDTGHQLLQTGRLATGGVEHPHFGAVLSYLRGTTADLPANVVLPFPIGPTGGNLPHGQSGGSLGRAFDPVLIDPEGDVRDRRLRAAVDLRGERPSVVEGYGRTRFGRDCLRARRLVERGVRFVTVNMYETVFDGVSWDAHGSAPFSPLSCYRDEVGPTFDHAYTALLRDLDRAGLLETTMVLACGEFGRTPRVNAVGGRDHHPGCWTALFAGGPIKGGQVVGASDPVGYEPVDRPVTPAEIAATVYEGLGVELASEIPGPDGRAVRVVDPGVAPVRELF